MDNRQVTTRRRFSAGRRSRRLVIAIGALAALCLAGSELQASIAFPEFEGASGGSALNRATGADSLAPMLAQTAAFSMAEDYSRSDHRVLELAHDIGMDCAPADTSGDRLPPDPRLWEKDPAPIVLPAGANQGVTGSGGWSSGGSSSPVLAVLPHLGQLDDLSPNARLFLDSALFLPDPPPVNLFRPPETAI